jgi:phage terminase large subunit-like protein
MDISVLSPEVIEKMSLAEKEALLQVLEQKERHLRENRLLYYKPYKKQMEFHSAGSILGVRERLLAAGNQLGKTLSAGAETAMHLTGMYPDDWKGKKFHAPTAGWAASVTGQVTRDAAQRILMGPPGQWGTGMIPADRIVEYKRAPHGVPDALESVTVRHNSGGLSRLTFKSYDQGREKFQGDTLDFVWLDEEPSDYDLYIEALTRTNATKGILYMTFTPLLGMTSVVKRFLTEKAPGTHVTSMTIYDADHYTDEERAAIIAAYPEHTRKARAEGIPMLGSGAVFPIAEEMITVEPFRIPEWWPRLVGVDFGWNHNFAAAWIALDPDTDTIYVYDCYTVRENTPIQHSIVITAKGKWIPVAWPADGLQHDKGSGVALHTQYKSAGVNMLGQKATFPDGSNSVEAGLLEMLDRMQTGRLKVFRHLTEWFNEFRIYHRKDGKLVKMDDDAISATRYAVMMKRYAKGLDVSGINKAFNQAGVKLDVLDPTAGY